jgi:hypothetical protein
MVFGSLMRSGMEAGVIPWENAHFLFLKLTFLISGVFWFYAFWAYAKAMGHSGLWAIAGIFSLPGLIVLLLLRDKN